MFFRDKPQKILAGEDQQPMKIAEECCACDEVKYEMSFAGYWSRQTHPKDFPTRKTFNQ